MHILIAPNAFKNSLDAVKAAEAISHGLHQSKLSCTTSLFPVADGGDGTAALLVKHLQGHWIQTPVHDPLGRKITASFGLADKGRLAIIELADASGLRLLFPEEYDPIHATSIGTGELILEALNQNVSGIILCIGGSATVDGGTGILQALGVTFFDAAGNKLDISPSNLMKLAYIDTKGIDKRIEKTTFNILCDVENPLLGPNGAPVVFGPQKGASPDDVQLLEKCLARFREVALGKTGKDMNLIKHGGAAGGVAAGLHTLLNAVLVNGIDHFLAVTGFAQQLEKADLVITGEGSLDEQTLQGKGPFGVAKKAREYGVPVIGLAGKLNHARELDAYFDRLICINEEGVPLEQAIRNTYSNLERTARLLGDQLSN